MPPLISVAELLVPTTANNEPLSPIKSLYKYHPPLVLFVTWNTASLTILISPEIIKSAALFATNARVPPLTFVSAPCNPLQLPVIERFPAPAFSNVPPVLAKLEPVDVIVLLIFSATLKVKVPSTSVFALSEKYLSSLESILTIK